MSSEGYSKYVDFQIQGLYDLYGKGSSQSASADKSYLSSLYQLASNQVSNAVNLHVQAKEKEKDSSKDGVKDKEGSEESKKGCHYKTTKVSDGSSKKSALASKIH